MCIALPLQVMRTEAGHAWVAGRGQLRRVNTALVGEPAVGDWLLVFLDSAREIVDAARAAEVNALLDLVQGALDGARPPPFEPAFVLPSSLGAEALATLVGPEGPTPTPLAETQQ